MEVNPGTLEMLELLHQYIHDRGFVICERSGEDNALQPTDVSLSDLYTDWVTEG